MDVTHMESNEEEGNELSQDVPSKTRVYHNKKLEKNIQQVN